MATLVTGSNPLNASLHKASIVGFMGEQVGDIAPQGRNANYLHAARYQNTVGTGMLEIIELYQEGFFGGGNIRLGVYADAGGAPSTLLAEAQWYGTGERPVQPGWLNGGLIMIPVIEGAWYWFAFVMNALNYFPFKSSTELYRAYTVQQYGALPASFPTPGYAYHRYLMRGQVRT
jgi:hypothetical protein